MPVAVGRWRFRGEVIAVFVGRWWQLFWGSKVVCFSVLARSWSGRRSPAWVSDGRVRLWRVLWGGSAVVLGGCCQPIVLSDCKSIFVGLVHLF